MSIETLNTDTAATPQAFAEELALRLEFTRQAELERALRRMSHLDEADKQRIDELSRQLVGSIIGLPIDRLRDARHHLPAARELFGLTNAFRSDGPYGRTAVRAPTTSPR